MLNLFSQIHASITPYSYPLRAEVENCNNKRLDELTGSIQEYKAVDSAGYDVHGVHIPFEQASQLLQRMVAPQEISLKVN
jgi:ATP-dependent DNA helicase PIF1